MSSSVRVTATDRPIAASVDSTEPAAWLSAFPVCSEVTDRLPVSVLFPAPRRASVFVSTRDTATTGDSARPDFTPALAIESTSRFDLAWIVTSFAPLMTPLSSTSAMTWWVGTANATDAPKPNLPASTVGSAWAVFFASSKAVSFSSPASLLASVPSASVTLPPVGSPAAMVERTSVVEIVNANAPATPMPLSAPAPDLAFDVNACCLSPLTSCMPVSSVMPSAVIEPPCRTSARFTRSARVTAAAAPAPNEPALTAWPSASVLSS